MNGTSFSGTFQTNNLMVTNSLKVNGLTTLNSLTIDKDQPNSVTTINQQLNINNNVKIGYSDNSNSVNSQIIELNGKSIIQTNSDTSSPHIQLGDQWRVAIAYHTNTTTNSLEEVLTIQYKDKETGLWTVKSIFTPSR